MIRMLHRILVFCDKKNARNIRLAYVFSFLNSFAQNAPVMAGIILIRELMEGTADAGRHPPSVFCARRIIQEHVGQISVFIRL